MSPGYLVRALNKLALLTRVVRRNGCDASIPEMRQKDKPLQNKKTNPERQKLQRITNRQKFIYQRPSGADETEREGHSTFMPSKGNCT